ncbi:hypothetical protein [Streptomyces sp. Inha503]|uniref:DUF7224 domain-containing protein n=1 Tax=Streptomyces sp. Inha503 TaxID=3383314 RepID=UPI0039A0511A
MDDQAGTVRTESRKAVARLRRVGVAVPATPTMADRPGPDQTKLAIGPGISAAGVPTGVAAGLLPQSPACADNGERYPAADAYGPVGAWLSLTAGASPRTLTNRVAPPELALAQHVLKQSRQAQLAWYERNTRAMRSCDVRPQLGIDGRHG